MPLIGQADERHAIAWEDAYELAMEKMSGDDDDE